MWYHGGVDPLQYMPDGQMWKATDWEWVWTLYFDVQKPDTASAALHERLCLVQPFEAELLVAFPPRKSAHCPRAQVVLDDVVMSVRGPELEGALAVLIGLSSPPQGLWDADKDICVMRWVNALAVPFPDGFSRRPEATDSDPTDDTKGPDVSGVDASGPSSTVPAALVLCNSVVVRILAPGNLVPNPCMFAAFSLYRCSKLLPK